MNRDRRLLEGNDGCYATLIATTLGCDAHLVKKKVRLNLLGKVKPSKMVSSISLLLAYGYDPKDIL